MTDTITQSAVQNTDRELWRERPGDFYADSIFVTERGGIGINCGGHVVVKPIRAWFALSRPTIVSEEAVTAAAHAMRKEDPVPLEMFTFDEIRDLARAALQAASVGGGDVKREAYLERRCKSAEDAMQFLAEAFPEGDIGMMFAVMQARAHWERYAPESPSVDADGNVAAQIEDDDVTFTPAHLKEIQRCVDQERERCAKIANACAEQWRMLPETNDIGNVTNKRRRLGMVDGAWMIAAAIRAQKGGE